MIGLAAVLEGSTVSVRLEASFGKFAVTAIGDRRSWKTQSRRVELLSGRGLSWKRPALRKSWRCDSIHSLKKYMDHYDTHPLDASCPNPPARAMPLPSAATPPTSTLRHRVMLEHDALSKALTEVRALPPTHTACPVQSAPGLEVLADSLTSHARSGSRRNAFHRTSSSIHRYQGIRRRHRQVTASNFARPRLLGMLKWWPKEGGLERQPSGLSAQQLVQDHDIVFDFFRKERLETKHRTGSTR